MQYVPKKRSSQRTADKILEAADELFGEKGFDGTSMRDVAERAGVHKALVFYHHNSKAELFARVLERYYAAHLDALAAAFDTDGSVYERLHLLIDAYFDFVEENDRYPRLIQQQTSTGGHEDLIERNLRPLYEWTQHVLREIAPAEGHLCARHFFITFSGMVINYFTYGRVMGRIWGMDPYTPEALEERRRHVHWILDMVLETLGKAKSGSRRR